MKNFTTQQFLADQNSRTQTDIAMIEEMEAYGEVPFASGTCLACGGRYSGILLKDIVNGNIDNCGCGPQPIHLSEVFNPKTAEVPALIYISKPLAAEEFRGTEIGINRLEGESAVDVSALTGEPLPLRGLESRFHCRWPTAYVIEQVILKEFREHRTFLRADRNRPTLEGLHVIQELLADEMGCSRPWLPITDEAYEIYYGENANDDRIISSLRASREKCDRDGLEVPYNDGLSEMIMGVQPDVLIERIEELLSLCQRFGPLRVLKTFLPGITIPEKIGDVEVIPGEALA